jgi:hypothetical protein
MQSGRRSWNYLTLLIFAPLLILAGILGFILPPQASLTSGAPAYNIFHIVFGLLGLALVLTKREVLIRAFNIGFGAIDIYQALASFTHLFPEQYFRWTVTDDVLHIVIGLGLLLIGFYRR